MKRLGLFLASILALVPAVAQANDWYVAADAGQAHFGDLSSQADGALSSQVGGTAVKGPQLSQPSQSLSADDSAYRLTGGYRFDPYWSLEASYTDLGRAEATGTISPLPVCGVVCQLSIAYDFSFKVRGFSLAGVGTLPLGERWSLFARLSTFHYSVTEDLTTVATSTGSTPNRVIGTVSTENTATGWKAAWGAGANYALSSGWALRVGFDQYHSLGDSSTTQGGVNLYTLGVVYNF